MSSSTPPKEPNKYEKDYYREEPGYFPAHWWDHESRPTSSEYSDLALMLGALSILTFWMFGLGIVVGATAIGVGFLSRRCGNPATDTGDWTVGLVGIITGAAGAAIGLFFLVAVLTYI